MHRQSVKSYNGQTKWMCFLIDDDDLLEKYNTILDKVSGDIKKEFDSNPAYNKHYLKTKINIMAMRYQTFTFKKFLI